MTWPGAPVVLVEEVDECVEIRSERAGFRAAMWVSAALLVAGAAITLTTIRDDALRSS